jgi:hypothetical protein
MQSQEPISADRRAIELVLVGLVEFDGYALDAGRYALIGIPQITPELTCIFASSGRSTRQTRRCGRHQSPRVNGIWRFSLACGRTPGVD